LLKNPTGRQSRVSVISFNDKKVVNSIFHDIAHSTAAHQDLRRQIFRQVAKSAKLQHMLLDVLSRHPELQTSVLRELAKNPGLKRKLVVVAHEEKKLQGTSTRKKAKTP
jgi:hypothetical protein